MLRRYGIPTIELRVAGDEEEAVREARAVGFPVVLKVLSPDIGHKTDVGGVAVDLRTEEEVREAFRRMRGSLEERVAEARIEGFLVQQYVRGGRETIIGVTQDPVFGPVIMFGLGGVYVEALRDVAFRIQPLSDVDAREMIRSIRGSRLLEGMRGEAPADLELLAEVLQRVSQLVGDRPEIGELDVNPFVVFADGGVAADAHIALAGERAPVRAVARAAVGADAE